MSKVICDVCGTSYPETTTQCPICGCAKNTTNQTTAQPDDADGTGYAPVKGGRFSKNNVRKRSQGTPPQRQTQPQPQPKSQPKPQPKPQPKKSEEGEGANKILVAIVVVLLLAIVAVVIYIGVRFLANLGGLDLPGDTGSSQTENTQPSETDPVEIKCQSIRIEGLPDDNLVELVAEGKKWMLTVEKFPAETTDALTFVSSDITVATVNENGIITAVGGGTCTITVSCGGKTLVVAVHCSFGEQLPPTTTVPPVTIPEGFELKLNRSDFTLSKEGETWTLYKETMGVKPSDITWVVDNPEVATVVNGKVTGVDRGTTTVYATYGDMTVSCIVRCSFDKAEPTKYTISTKDVTVTEGETFWIRLRDKDGVNVEVEWVASEEGYLDIDENKFTAIAHTQDVSGRYIRVSCTIDGETHTCIVRIYPKPEPSETTAPET